MYLNLRRVSE